MRICLAINTTRAVLRTLNMFFCMLVPARVCSALGSQPFTGLLRRISNLTLHQKSVLLCDEMVNMLLMEEGNLMGMLNCTIKTTLRIFIENQ